MNITLKNNLTEATISTYGAELISFKREDKEYMWEGDAKYWRYHSPVLFPIVGSLHNQSYILDGKTYEMKNHGFGRISEFECLDHSDNAAIFKLSYSEDTLSSYPFLFELYLKYTLIDNHITINYEVHNKDTKEIYFQLGTHPAFMCPINEGEDLTDYYLEFEKKETKDRYPIVNHGIDLDHGERVLTDENILELKPEQYYRDAIIFTDIQSRQIALKSNKSANSVTVTFNNLPDLGIWQPKDAPFLCIEPWHGIGDIVGFKSDFKEKERIASLAPCEIFKASLSIEIN